MRRVAVRRGACDATVLGAAAIVLAAWLGPAGCHGRSRRPAGSLVAPAASASAAARSEPDPGRPHVAELNLGGGVPELSCKALLASPSKRSFADLVATMQALAPSRDERVKGLLVRFGDPGLGFARAHEIASELAAARASGLPVVCHADELGNSTWAVAAAGCDRIWLSPAGMLETVGIAAQVLYAKRLLGELKVDVDMLQVGRFKGAAEPVTREGPSPEARESLERTLRSLRASWLVAAAKRPGLKGGPEQLERGPYSPEEAVAAGLVDGIGYLDEARANARELAHVDQVVPRFGAGAKGRETPGLLGLVRVLSGAGGLGGAPHVAVVRAVGAITQDPARGPFEDCQGISSRRLGRTLERLRADDAAKAVVLRIDSPGGSALASDLLWAELRALRRVKPLVVSVGDMAASGGYYLASAGTRIFADPTSIVGSIGVVGGKLSVGRGLEHVGVHAEVFPASPEPGARERAAFLSPFVPWDAPTRERMLATMTSVYDLFVRRVAEGRSMRADRVAGFAEGRIFSGADAVGLGMVDELGGLREAVAHARRAAGLDADAPARVVGEESPLEQLLEMDDEDLEGKASAGADPAGMATALLGAAAPGLGVFVRSFEPVVRGEHALVAVPFSLLVR
jgi:protease-4